MLLPGLTHTNISQNISPPFPTHGNIKIEIPGLRKKWELQY
jgi:hypothetical protein